MLKVSGSLPSNQYKLHVLGQKINFLPTLAGFSPRYGNPVASTLIIISGKEFSRNILSYNILWILFHSDSCVQSIVNQSRFSSCLLREIGKRCVPYKMRNTVLQNFKYMLIWDCTILGLCFLLAQNSNNLWHLSNTFSI